MIREIDRANYPGLNTSSVDLWRAWLKYYEGDFFSYEYNVRVGQGIHAPAYLSEQEKELWKKLTQKRIDVVAHRWDSDWIIEIVDRPGLASIGQLIGYFHLSEEYLTLKHPVRLALICARLGYDMAKIFRQQNVLVFFFPPGKPPSFPPAYKPSDMKPAPSS